MFLNVKRCMRKASNIYFVYTSHIATARTLHLTVEKNKTSPGHTLTRALEIINGRQGGHNDKRIDSGSRNAF